MLRARAAARVGRGRHRTARRGPTGVYSWCGAAYIHRTHGVLTGYRSMELGAAPPAVVGSARFGCGRVTQYHEYIAGTSHLHAPECTVRSSPYRALRSQRALLQPLLCLSCASRIAAHTCATVGCRSAIRRERVWPQRCKLRLQRADYPPSDTLSDDA